MELYAVRSQEGEYFSESGYEGRGTNWVDSLNKAKIYLKASDAEAKIKYFAKHFPDFGVPELIILDARIWKVMQQNEVIEQNDQSRVSDIINRFKRQEYKKKIAMLKLKKKLIDNEIELEMELLEMLSD